MDLLLDTNVILYFLGGDQRVIKLVSLADRLAVSFISEIELFSYSMDEQELKSIE